jgi:hypothetical protein
VGGRATLFYITKVAQAQKDGTDLRLYVPLRKDFPLGPDGEAEFSRTKKRIIRGQPPMEFTESDFDETSGNESLFTALATESMKLAVHDLHTGLSDFEDSPEEENKEQKKPEIDGAVTEVRKVTKKREKKKRTKSDRPPKPEKWADMSKGDYEKYIARPISQNEWAQTRHNWATNEKVEGEIRLTAGAAAARILSGAEATQMRLPLESTSEQMSRKDYEKYIRRMVPEGEWLEIQKLWTTGPLEELDRTIEHPTLTIREVAVIRRGPLKDGYLPRLPASTRRELGDDDWSSIFKQYFMTCRSFGSMLFNRQKFEFYLGANISDYIFALFWNTYAETPEYHHFSKRLHPDGRLIRLKELVDETQMVKPQCKVEYQDVVGRWVTNDEYQLAMVQLHIEAQAFPLNNVPIIDQTERRMRFETLIGHRTRDSQWDYTRAHGERNTYLGTQIGDEISKFDDDNWARAREEGRERMRQQRNWPPNPDLVDTSLQPTYLLQQDAYQLAAILQEITAIEFEKGYEDAPFRTSNKEKGPTPTELEWVLFRKLAPEEYQILYLRPEQRRLNEQTITELERGINQLPTDASRNAAFLLDGDGNLLVEEACPSGDGSTCLLPMTAADIAFLLDRMPTADFTEQFGQGFRKRGTGVGPTQKEVETQLGRRLFFIEYQALFMLPATEYAKRMEERRSKLPRHLFCQTPIRSGGQAERASDESQTSSQLQTRMNPPAEAILLDSGAEVLTNAVERAMQEWPNPNAPPKLTEEQSKQIDKAIEKSLVDDPDLQLSPEKSKQIDEEIVRSLQENPDTTRVTSEQVDEIERLIQEGTRAHKKWSSARYQKIQEAIEALRTHLPREITPMDVSGRQPGITPNQTEASARQPKGASGGEPEEEEEVMRPPSQLSSENEGMELAGGMRLQVLRHHQFDPQFASMPYHEEPIRPGMEGKFCYRLGLVDLNKVDTNGREPWSRPYDHSDKDDEGQEHSDIFWPIRTFIHEVNPAWGEVPIVGLYLTDRILYLLSAETMERIHRIYQHYLPPGVSPVHPYKPNRDSHLLYEDCGYYYDDPAVEEHGYADPCPVPVTEPENFRRSVFKPENIKTVPECLARAVSFVWSTQSPHPTVPEKCPSQPWTRILLPSFNPEDIRDLTIPPDTPVPLATASGDVRARPIRDVQRAQILLYWYNCLAEELKLIWMDLISARYTVFTKMMAPPGASETYQYFDCQHHVSCRMALLAAIHQAQFMSDGRNLIGAMDVEYFYTMFQPCRLFKAALWLDKLPSHSTYYPEEIEAQFCDFMNYTGKDGVEVNFRKNRFPMGSLIRMAKEDLDRFRSMNILYETQTSRGPFAAVIHVKLLGSSSIIMSLNHCNGKLNPFLDYIIKSRHVIKFMVDAKGDMEALFNSFGYTLSYKNGIFDIPVVFPWDEIKAGGRMSTMDLASFVTGITYAGAYEHPDDFRAVQRQGDWFPLDGRLTADQLSYLNFELITTLAAGMILVVTRPDRIYYAVGSIRDRSDDRVRVEQHMATSVRSVVLLPDRIFAQRFVHINSEDDNLTLEEELSRAERAMSTSPRRFEEGMPPEDIITPRLQSLMQEVQDYEAKSESIANQSTKEGLRIIKNEYVCGPASWYDRVENEHRLKIMKHRSLRDRDQPLGFFGSRDQWMCNRANWTRIGHDDDQALGHHRGPYGTAPTDRPSIFAEGIEHDAKLSGAENRTGANTLVGISYKMFGKMASLRAHVRKIASGCGLTDGREIEIKGNREVEEPIPNRISPLAPVDMLMVENLRRWMMAKALLNAPHRVDQDWAYHVNLAGDIRLFDTKNENILPDGMMAESSRFRRLAAKYPVTIRNGIKFPGAAHQLASSFIDNRWWTQTGPMYEVEKRNYLKSIDMAMKAQMCRQDRQLLKSQKEIVKNLTSAMDIGSLVTIKEKPGMDEVPPGQPWDEDVWETKEGNEARFELPPTYNARDAEMEKEQRKEQRGTYDYRLVTCRRIGPREQIRYHWDMRPKLRRKKWLPPRSLDFGYNWGPSDEIDKVYRTLPITAFKVETACLRKLTPFPMRTMKQLSEATPDRLALRPQIEQQEMMDMGSLDLDELQYRSSGDEAEKQTRPRRRIRPDGQAGWRVEEGPPASPSISAVSRASGRNSPTTQEQAEAHHAMPPSQNIVLELTELPLFLPDHVAPLPGMPIHEADPDGYNGEIMNQAALMEIRVKNREQGEVIQQGLIHSEGTLPVEIIAPYLTNNNPMGLAQAASYCMGRNECDTPDRFRNSFLNYFPLNEIANQYQYHPTATDMAPNLDIPALGIGGLNPNVLDVWRSVCLIDVLVKLKQYLVGVRNYDLVQLFYWSMPEYWRNYLELIAGSQKSGAREDQEYTFTYDDGFFFLGRTGLMNMLNYITLAIRKNQIRLQLPNVQPLTPREETLWNRLYKPQGHQGNYVIHEWGLMTTQLDEIAINYEYNLLIDEPDIRVVGRADWREDTGEILHEKFLSIEQLEGKNENLSRQQYSILRRQRWDPVELAKHCRIISIAYDRLTEQPMSDNWTIKEEFISAKCLSNDGKFLDMDYVQAMITDSLPREVQRLQVGPPRSRLDSQSSSSSSSSIARAWPGQLDFHALRQAWYTGDPGPGADGPWNLEIRRGRTLSEREQAEQEEEDTAFSGHRRRPD